MVIHAQQNQSRARKEAVIVTCCGTIEMRGDLLNRISLFERSMATTKSRDLLPLPRGERSGVRGATELFRASRNVVTAGGGTPVANRCHSADHRLGNWCHSSDHRFSNRHHIA